MSDAFEDRGTMCHPALLNRLVTCSRTRKQPHGQLMICFGLTLRYLLYDISIKFFNSVCSSAAFLGDTREHLIGRPSTIDFALFADAVTLSVDLEDCPIDSLRILFVFVSVCRK
eukprot:GHVN01066254.1.p1 GENE.GHVN01066254.1~~GHVN01066254.1.p1  ORF type:complete len:114 (-),score=7.66 GHVN01066254.1:200-541(-)